MFKKYLSYLMVVMAVMAMVSDADAATKKKKKKKPTAPAGVLVSASDLFSVSVKVKVGKKSSNQAIFCLDTTPGLTSTIKGSLRFISFNSSVKSLKRKKDKKSKSKLALHQALVRAGKTACVNPDFLSLAQYKGTFGPAEARILYNRFAFGANPDTIATAVSAGLDGAVNRLMTIVPDPGLDAIEADLQCDGRLASDQYNENCDPTDPNDLYREGVRYALEYRMWYSANPYLDKLFFFFHDERIASSVGALSWNQSYGVRDYINMIRRLTLDGNYRNYMEGQRENLMASMRDLDLAKNYGHSPNENYAREFWELGTIGPVGLDGRPNYSDVDIAQSALAFSGYDTDEKTINGHSISYWTFSPAIHAQGAKVIFGGTPYQTVVDDADDVARATYNHPRFAEHLAEDIWKEFINPYATPHAIKELAQLIRDNDFNLHPVMRRIMTSRAFYAARSRNSLIKHPLDKIIGFLKTTGLPLGYWDLDDILSDMGQQLLSPPSVFGWNEQRLAAEARVLDWRNSLLRIVNQGDEDLLEKGYDIKRRLLAGIPPTGEASRQTILSFADRLNVTLNEPQIAALTQYMDWNLIRCWDPSRCGGQQYKLERAQFDLNPDADSGEKIRGLLLILAEMPQYGMK